MIEKQIVKNRFGKSGGTYHKQAKIQQEIAERLGDLLSQMNAKEFPSILEIGCGTGFLTQKILTNFAFDQYFINDLVDPENILESRIKSRLSSKFVQFYPGDAETIPLPGNLDAIFSASCFQWFNELESFFFKIKPLLNSNGWLAFSTFGPENFKEIKTILGTGLEYHSMENIMQLLGNDFEIIHAEEWLDSLKFKSPFEVLKHIKSTGVNGVSNQYFGKEKLQEFQDQYLQLFGNHDQSIHLTYHPIIIIARKK